MLDQIKRSHQIEQRLRTHEYSSCPAVSNTSNSATSSSIIHCFRYESLQNECEKQLVRKSWERGFLRFSMRCCAYSCFRIKQACDKVSKGDRGDWNGTCLLGPTKLARSSPCKVQYLSLSPHSNLRFTAHSRSRSGSLSIV